MASKKLTGYGRFKVELATAKRSGEMKDYEIACKFASRLHIIHRPEAYLGVVTALVEAEKVDFARKFAAKAPHTPLGVTARLVIASATRDENDFERACKSAVRIRSAGGCSTALHSVVEALAHAEMYDLARKVAARITHNAPDRTSAYLIIAQKTGEVGDLALVRESAAKISSVSVRSEFQLRIAKETRAVEDFKLAIESVSRIKSLRTRLRLQIIDALIEAEQLDLAREYAGSAQDFRFGYDAYKAIAITTAKKSDFELALMFADMLIT